MKSQLDPHRIVWRVNTPETPQSSKTIEVTEHPAWCHPQHCFVTDEGVQVHQQAPIRWEDDTGELRCESRLLDPSDDDHVYLELDLQCLRLSSNRFSWIVPLDTARRLRDQLTTHLDSGTTDTLHRR